MRLVCEETNQDRQAMMQTIWEMDVLLSKQMRKEKTIVKRIYFLHDLGVVFLDMQYDKMDALVTSGKELAPLFQKVASKFQQDLLYTSNKID